MKNGEDMRKILLAISWIIFAYFAVAYFLGKLDTYSKNVFYVFCTVIVCSIVIKIKMNYFDPYNNLKDMYEKLRNLHYARYKLYISSENNKEKINFYSREIQILGKAIIARGEELTRNRLYSKKRKIKIQEIINQAKKLMQRETPI